MPQEHTAYPWSDEGYAAADSFMDNAAKLLYEYLEPSGLHVWRGNQNNGYSTYATDTIVISQQKTAWSEDRPKEGFLLWIQEHGMGVEFDVHIGSETFESSMPFGGGWVPLERVENLAPKLAHLSLSLPGSELMSLITQRAIELNKGSIVHSEVCKSGGQTFYRCDVYNCLTEEDWFCVAFLLNEDRQVGIWTRNDSSRYTKFHEIDFGHDFTDTTQTGWIDEVLLSNPVLDELTR